MTISENILGVFSRAIIFAYLKHYLLLFVHYVFHFINS